MIGDAIARIPAGGLEIAGLIATLISRQILSLPQEWLRFPAFVSDRSCCFTLIKRKLIAGPWARG
jgi:hypothetical protein